MNTTKTVNKKSDETQRTWEETIQAFEDAVSRLEVIDFELINVPNSLQ